MASLPTQDPKEASALHMLFMRNSRRWTNQTMTKCEEFNQPLFHLWLLLPSCLIIITMMMLRKRQRLAPECCWGRPGVVFPIDFLSAGRSRFTYAAALVIVADLCVNLVLEKTAIAVQGPPFMKVLAKLTTMLIYGSATFPIVAGITMGDLPSLILGMMYAWMYFIMQLYQVFKCVSNFGMEFSFSQMVVPMIPILVSSGFVSSSHIYRIFVLLKEWRNSSTEKYNSWMTLLQMAKPEYKTTYFTDYTRNLLKKATRKSHRQNSFCCFPKCKWDDTDTEGSSTSNFVQRAKRWVKQIISCIYRNVEGFRYSTRFISTYAVALTVVYMAVCEISFLLADVMMQALIKHFDVVDDRTLREAYRALANVSFITQLMHESRDAYRVLHHWLVVFRVILILGITMTIGLVIVQTFLAFKAYRRDRLRCARGEFPKPTLPQGGPGVLLSFIKYSSYQIAYIFIGSIIQLLTVVGLLCFLAYAFFIPAIFKWNMWFIDYLKEYWPVLLVVTLLVLLKKLLAKYLFLEDRGQTFAVKNRSVLFCCMWFLYYYELFIGFLSFIKERIRVLFLSVFFIGRMDLSPYLDNMRYMDNAFRAYNGMIIMENAHQNSVMLSFVHLLQSSIKPDQLSHDKSLVGEDEIDVGYRKSVKCPRAFARRRWCLAFTLIRNPSLAALRKHKLEMKSKPEEGPSNLEDVKYLMKSTVKSALPFSIGRIIK